MTLLLQAVGPIWQSVAVPQPRVLLDVGMTTSFSQAADKLFTGIVVLSVWAPDGLHDTLIHMSLATQVNVNEFVGVLWEAFGHKARAADACDLQDYTC